MAWARRRAPGVCSRFQRPGEAALRHATWAGTREGPSRHSTPQRRRTGVGLDILGQPRHSAAGRPAALPMEEYQTVPQVAELLQLSRTVYRRPHPEGEATGTQGGGSWRFRRRDIDAWAAEQIQGKSKKKQ